MQTQNSLIVGAALPVVANPIGWILLWNDNFSLASAQVYSTKRIADAARKRAWPHLLETHGPGRLIACPLSAAHLQAIRSERAELRERVQILGARIEDLISDRDKWKGIARDGGQSNG